MDWKMILSLVAELVGDIAGTSKIGKVIDMLTSALSAGIDGYTDIKPDVDRIIEALRGSDDITDEQLKALDEVESLSDAEFEKAAAAAGFPAN